MQTALFEQDGVLYRALVLVGPGEFLYVATVCRQFRDAYRRMHLNTRSRCCTRLRTDHQGTEYAAAVTSLSRFEIACESGLQLHFTETSLQTAVGRSADLSTIHAAFERGLPKSVCVMSGVQDSDSVDLLQWLVASHGYDLPQVAEGKSLPLVQYLIGQGACVYPGRTHYHTALDGSLAVIQYLFTADECRHLPQAECMNEILRGAATGGHKHILRWALQHPLGRAAVEGSTQLLDAACGSGNIELLMWLADEAGRDFTDANLESAAAEGHLDALKYLLSLRDHVDGELAMSLLQAAAHLPHIDLCEWLIEHHECELTEDLYLHAAWRNASVRCIQWLHEDKQIPWNAYYIASTVATEGGIEILQYMHEQGLIQQFRPDQMQELLAIAGQQALHHLGPQFQTAIWLRAHGARWPDSLCIQNENFTQPWPERSVNWARSQGCTSPVPDPSCE